MKVYVINIKEATGRLQHFKDTYPSILPEYTVWEAKTGDMVDVPYWWQSTANRYALVQNFIDIFAENLESEEDVLIFEDDCLFCEDFNYWYTEYMKQVPDDYDMIYLGAQNYMYPRKVSDLVVKQNSCFCGHAIIYAPNAIRKLHEMFTEPVWGCKHYSDQRKAQAISAGIVKAYSPLVNLCGQYEEYSYLMDTVRPVRWYNDYKLIVGSTLGDTCLCRYDKEDQVKGLKDLFTEINNENGLTGLMVGVYKGEGTKIICDNANINHLYGIDSYVYPYSSIDEPMVKYYMRDYTDKFTLIRGNSLDPSVIAKIPNNLDFIYIDGNHKYDFITRDLANYVPKLKEGGYILGHDYYTNSVKQAVDEYAEANNYSIKLYEDSSWRLIHE